MSLEHCDECGQDYDPRYLDQVLFHNTDHKLRQATGVVGERVNRPVGLKNTELMGVSDQPAEE